MPSQDAVGVADRLEFWNRADPEAPAMGSVNGPMLNRGQLAGLMSAARGFLESHRIGAEDRVAVLLPEGFDGAVTTLQVAGACSVAPVRPSLGAAGWETVLGGLAPAALVVGDRWPEAAAAARDLGIRVFDPAQLSDGKPVTSAPAGQPELLLATSGSTGAPKWVRIPQPQMMAGSLAMSRCMNLTPNDRSLLALPLNHAHGLASGLLLPLISGGSVVVADSFAPALFLKAVTDHAVTWFTVPPVMHRALLEQITLSPLDSGHRLRLVRSGTVTLPASAIEALSAAFGVPVLEAYGMTECPHIACNPIGEQRLGSVGQAVVEELAIIDNEGRPVAPGEWGQVALRGAPLMAGYLDPAADAGVFRDGWLLSGDEGRLDAEGYLFLRGRISERINRGGAMVAPAEVDAALLSHPAVREAVSFAVPHVSLGEDLAAAVVVASGQSADEAALRRYLAGRLEPRQVPSRIVALDAIPLGAAGKVARGALAEALADVLHAEYEPGRMPAEDAVIEFFTEALESRLPAGYKVGRLTNFFLAGGDSLAALQVMTRLARAGWGERAPALLFENPTPAAVAAALEAEPRHASSLVALKSEGHREPVIVVHGKGGQLFHYLDLAAALAPHRPVLGLQAAGCSAQGLAELTLNDVAARYADDILAARPHGPIHLVGYSLGGWFAFAVVAALLERGAQIGMCALLDSHPSRESSIFASLPRRLQWVQHITKALERGPGGVGRGAHLARMARNVLNRGNGNGPSAGVPDMFSLLLRGYRPPRLAIAVDVFGPERTMKRLRRTWQYYATGGVRCHPMFDAHTDMVSHENMPALAVELERVLTRLTP